MATNGIAEHGKLVSLQTLVPEMHAMNFKRFGQDLWSVQHTPAAANVLVAHNTVKQSIPHFYPVKLIWLMYAS